MERSFLSISDKSYLINCYTKEDYKASVVVFNERKSVYKFYYMLTELTESILLGGIEKWDFEDWWQIGNEHRPECEDGSSAPAQYSVFAHVSANLVRS